MILHTDYHSAIGGEVTYEMINGIGTEEGFTNCNAEDSGSENAPEDSAYISDEDEYQDRIVNESSLMNEDDDNLILTARSESAIDEDDDVTSLSKCKAINSSYINLKGNYMLVAFPSKK